MENAIIEQIDTILDEGLFKNKSHFIEYAVNKFIQRGQK